MTTLTQENCDKYWKKKEELLEKSKTIDGSVEIAKEAHDKIGQYVTSMHEAIHSIAMFHAMEIL